MEGQTTQWLKEKGQDLQWFTQHYTENWRSSNTNTLLIMRNFWEEEKEKKFGSGTWQKASEYKLCIPKLEKQPTTVPDTRYLKCSDVFGIRVHNQLF